MSKAAFVKIAPFRQAESVSPAPGAAASRPAKADFRRDVEGLRAVAVLAVVLFHAGLPGVGGGYVGVDVFFVISGFLITGQLWREVATTGAVKLGRFYGARALAIATCFGHRGRCHRNRISDLPASLAGSPRPRRRGDQCAIRGNYGLAVQGTDYLASDLPPSPFQHYWSLGVEEQFYLVWPALIIGVGLSRRMKHSVGERPSPQIPYLLVLALVASASFALSLLWTHTQPSWAFFLLAHSGLAIGRRRARRADGQSMATTASVSRRCLGLRWPRRSSLGIVQAGHFHADPGTAALAPVLGTALVIAAGCAAPSSGAWRALHLAADASGRPDLVLVVSLALAVPPFAAPLVDHPLGLIGRLAAVAVSGGIAAITLNLVENPCRSATSLRQSPARSLAVGVRPLLSRHAPRSTTCPHTHSSRPWPRRPAITITEGSRSTSHDIHDVATARAYAQVQAAVAAFAGLGAVPSNRHPPLANASGDRAAILVTGCLRSFDQVGQAKCPGMATLRR